MPSSDTDVDRKDRKKKIITEEVPIGEAGVDKGFKDIGINKKDRYVGKLGGDEKYIDNSECDSYDSTDMLDAEAVGGVDLPGRRKRKKVRYDDECTVAIFELGMIFENAKEFRKALTKYATFEVKFNKELYKMSRLGNEINDDLLHYPQVSWVRAFFQEHSKCDTVENNMCETFYSWILSCRHKSIITILEEIMRKLMTRTMDMVKFADTWICDIVTRLMLEENKEKSMACKVLWNADVGFEIGEGQYKHTINLPNRVCSCRTGQLRGIPCQHAIFALYHIEQEPEPLVGVHTSQLASPVHNLLLVKVHKKVAILNQQAPTNLDQQDSTNLYQQYQAIMLLQQQFVVIPVELRGKGKLQKQANHHHLWIQVFLLQEE
ncbi:hypothetical protein H5410_033640 [Solanum commersonii]|uniref:SWIM-type domain-containing protein n=1 Tax=Solanum commersonii TaxID=4109 RepID=A0A9J5YTP1_SOLCO|nr:hypothetical protein H5410_033640 [Solanum commersonii]